MKILSFKCSIKLKSRTINTWRYLEVFEWTLKSKKKNDEININLN